MTGTAFAVPQVEVVHRPDGATVLRSTAPCTPTPPSTLHWLARWAAVAPARVLLSETDGSRRTLHTYGAVWSLVRAEADSLIQAGIGRGDRVVVLAPNGLLHFVVGHAAMLIGAIYAPVAAQYAAPGADPGRLLGVLGLLRPSLVVVGPGRATTGLQVESLVRDRLVGTAPQDDDPDCSGDALLEAVERDAPAKLLLTSGSTGTPKAVTYTNRMLTANAQATADVWPFITRRPPVLVDWLPWNHAFGGNANLNLVLLGGGTLHVDSSGGRPGTQAGLIDAVRELRPTFYAAVPSGFHALLPVLQRDLRFRAALLGGCDALFSAGAAMSAPTFLRLRELSSTVRDRPIPILSGWGSTEVGPGATLVHTEAGQPGWVGPPLPGTMIKLVPHEGKLEARVRSDSVMPGYWGQPDLTAGVFDEDGFFRSGDAVAFVDEQRPSLGLRFDGRLADDFKLANGSWVNVERLRGSLLTLGGADVRDVVLAGPDRSTLVALFWLRSGSSLDVDDVIARHNAIHSGQTNTIAAAGSVEGQLDAAVLTPKGAIRPTAFRAAETLRFEALYTAARQEVLSDHC